MLHKERAKLFGSLLSFQYKINRKSTKIKETTYKLYKYKPKTSWQFLLKSIYLHLLKNEK